MPCLLCYDEKNENNHNIVGVILWFLQKVSFDSFSVQVFSSGFRWYLLMAALQSFCCSLYWAALINHILSQRKRMKVLEKEVAELKEKMEALEQLKP